jgi:hypothetical protein
VTARRTHPSAWLTVSVTTTFQFACWCAGDVLWVRWGVRSLDPVLLAVPVFTIAAHLWLAQPRTAGQVAKSIALSLASTALAALLFGIPFHFWLGGSL